MKFLVDETQEPIRSNSSDISNQGSTFKLLTFCIMKHTCVLQGEGVPDGFPFELNDNPGQQTVSLSREYQGEAILVEVEPSSLVTGQEDDEDDDKDDNDTENDNQSSIPMVVKVSKTGGPCLEFGVTAYADEIVIDSLSVKDPDMTDDQLPYEGPRFE